MTLSKNTFYSLAFCILLPLIRVILTKQYIHLQALWHFMLELNIEKTVNILRYNVTHLFLFWNLFLAFIPLYIAMKGKVVENVLCSKILDFLWLLFLPNSFYIFTDFIHLFKLNNPLNSYSQMRLIWFDIIMFYSYSQLGFLFGFHSLNIMRQKYKHKIFPIVILVLSGFGIYLGRFLRLNSWDIFTDTTFTVILIKNSIIHLEVISFTLFVFVFLYTLYKTYYRKVIFKDNEI